MKNLKYILFSFCLLFFICCRKDNQSEPVYQANLTIINGLADRDGLVWKFSDVEFSFDQFRSYYFNNGYFDSEETIGMPVNIDVPIVMADYNDSTKIVYKSNKVFKPRDLYTLYLSGKANQIDTMMVQEKELPYHNNKDSVMSVRFINIAPELAGISVNLSGQSQGSEINNLQYKGITAFRVYPTGFKDVRYTFEFHNSATGELLGTYQFQPNDPNYRVPRFKTLSLIFKGLNDRGFRIVRVDY
jgi:hypothetical protein